MLSFIVLSCSQTRHLGLMGKSQVLLTFHTSYEIPVVKLRQQDVQEVKIVYSVSNCEYLRETYNIVYHSDLYHSQQTSQFSMNLARYDDINPMGTFFLPCNFRDENSCLNDLILMYKTEEFPKYLTQFSNRNSCRRSFQISAVDVGFSLFLFSFFFFVLNFS